MSSSEARRQVLVHAAGAEVVRMQARAGDPLVELHQLLALLERPEERRHRADIQREGGDVEQVVEDAGDLVEQHADILAARRHFDAQQLLDRQREGVLLAHRRDVIEPVEIGDRLEVGLVLDQLLGAAMQQADMRDRRAHHLAVHLQHQAQHAVRRRMLRPEIHGQRLDLDFGHQSTWSPSRRPAAGAAAHAFPRAEEIEAAEILGQLHRLVDHALLLLVVAHLDIAGQREVLAQRMPLEAVVGEDAAQVRMVGEEDAVQVPGLALEPAGGRNRPSDRRHRRRPRRSSPSPGRAGYA